MWVQLFKYESILPPAGVKQHCAFYFSCHHMIYSHSFIPNCLFQRLFVLPLSVFSSPVISQCLWRRWGRTSTLKCSCRRACTVSASAGSTPWTSWWSTTRKPPSLPANMERSCTWSKRCCDLHILTPTLDLPHTHAHTQNLAYSTHYTHIILTPLPNCLNSSLSSEHSRCGVCNHGQILSSC